MNIAIIGADAESVHAIKKAQALGHRVICVDKDPKAAGVLSADKVITLDISKEEEVIRALEPEKIDFCMTTPIGRHLVTIGAVNDALKLPGISRECAVLCTDKYAFHNRLRNVRLRTGYCYLADGVHPIDLTKVKYPCVFKPRFGSHGRSVHYISNEGELVDLIDKIWGEKENTTDSKDSVSPTGIGEKEDSSDISFSRKAGEFMASIKMTMEEKRSAASGEDRADDEYILEEALPGIEYAVDGVVEGCNFVTVLIRRKVLTRPPARQAVVYMNLMPGDNPRVEAQISEYMGRLCEVIGFRECLLHADICIQGRTVNVIEISASPAGRHVYDELIPMATGVDMAEQFIRYMAGDSHVFQPLNRKRILLGYFGMQNCFVHDVPDIDRIKNILPESVTLRKWECNIKMLDYLGRITDESSLLSRGCYLLEGVNDRILYETSDRIQDSFETK